MAVSIALLTATMACAIGAVTSTAVHGHPTFRRTTENIPDDARPFWPKYTHNNVINFPLVSGESTAGYFVDTYTISHPGDEGKCGHVIAAGQPYSGMSQPSPSSLDIIAGRHGSSGVAGAFNEGLSPQNAMTSWSIEEHVVASLPGALNFYVGDIYHNLGCALGFNISGNIILCPGIRFGQGHVDVHNNWWIGGPLCHGDGGTDPINCLCNNTSDNWVSTYITFVSGSGDNTFDVRAQCSDGYNCECASCAVGGYTYFCTNARECHDTQDTCLLGCSDVGSCVDTSTCQPPQTCSAAQQADCNGTTCCTYFQGNAAAWWSTPYCTDGPGDTCCGSDGSYCPANYTCDIPTSQCIPNLPPGAPPTEECSVCRKIVEMIVGHEGDGACDAACDLLGPIAELCDLVMKAGLCDYITKALGAGKAPDVICDEVGACSTGLTCECGTCSPGFFGQWCLALDAQCPASENRMRRHPLAPGMSDSRMPKVMWKPMARVLPNTPTLGFFDHWRVPYEVKDPIPPLQQICVTSMCDASNAGCCLTCAP